MYYSDDPERDFLRRDAEQEDELDRLPKCDICGEPIQDDHFYIISCDKVCRECLDNECRVQTEDYVA